MRTVGGVVTALARKYTKRGDLMATFVLEDLGGAVEVMVFPKTMASYGELLTEDAIVCVKARIDMREDAPKLIAMEITQPPLVIDGGQPVRIRTRPGALERPEGRAAEGGAPPAPGGQPGARLHRGRREDDGRVVGRRPSACRIATACSPSSGSCSAPTASWRPRPLRR